MQKSKKRFYVVLVAILVFTSVGFYGLSPIAEAASLTDAKDTISDSNIGAGSVLHTVTFTTTTAVPDSGRIEINFPAEVTGLATVNMTCAGTSTAIVSGQSASCLAASGEIAAGAKTITIGTTTNPGTAGSYLISIITRDSGGTEIERSDVRIYIISNVSVSGHVDASLTFAINGLATTGDDVNTAVTTATSTASLITFGTLTPNATSTIAQELSVGTNATDGYVVTVRQNHELQSAGGASIRSFNNAPVGQGSTTPVAWANPTGSLTNANTWGHMAITSNDTTVDGIDYTSGKFAGLAGASPLIVMSHTGPANGTTQDIGSARVAYSVMITALQAAGDYSNTLTYIVTPQF